MNVLAIFCLIICFLIGSSYGNIFGRTQKVSVKGRVFCPSDPQKAHNVQVKLMDEDDC